MREYLRDYRNKVGKSQAKMAQEIGISRNYYFYIESGERQKDMGVGLLAKISAALSQPLENLVKDERKYQAQLKDKTSSVS